MNTNKFHALGKLHSQYYDRIIHKPADLRVKNSYESLISALYSQFEAIENIGYHFELGENIYMSSVDMFNQIQTTHIITIYDTKYTQSNMPLDHPMLQRVIKNFTANDIFRGVHDYIGHYIPRNSFGPKGEYNAWLCHMASLPKASWVALFCETRGQNAWTNYADNHNLLPLKDRPFPQQKAGWINPELILPAAEDRPKYFPTSPV